MAASSSCLGARLLLPRQPPNFLRSPVSRIQFLQRKVTSLHASEEEENGEENQKKRISEQSSWEAKDSLGKDYLYRLGQEADNVNIAVGAKQGVIDDLFVGNFLGRDCMFFFQILCLDGLIEGIWVYVFSRSGYSL